MFKLKGLYEWKLTNIDTGAVDCEGQQYNVVSDRFLNFLCSDGSYGGYNNMMAIELSDTVPDVGIDYRFEGLSNWFNLLVVGADQTYQVDWVLNSKYCDNTFSPGVSPRTITVIGVKLKNALSTAFDTPNFVSFIELSAPITQNTNQYLYVKYTIFVTFSSGLGYNVPDNRFLEYALNKGIFTNEFRVFNAIASVDVTPFLPASDFDNVARNVTTLYNYTTKATNYGSRFSQWFSKTFAVADIPGPIGSVVFQHSNYYSYSTSYTYLYALLGYSQVKDMAPAVSRVFVHPSTRNAYIFSDPSYPAVSLGTVAITGTPTNKYPVTGRIKITQTGDASDLVDETVPYTAVNTGTSEITVAQTFAVGDKYRLTTTGGLPSPLLTDTDYYIIYINATTIKLAATYLDAIGGTFITLTTQGTAYHTLIRQNTGRYRLELEPWAYQEAAGYGGSLTLTQLSMAIDYDGYVMPANLNSQDNNAQNYAEGDHIADQASYSEFYSKASASMLRGTAKNGDYIYSVQQSRKGLINNVCRWKFNTIETSQPLCKFGTGSTKVSSVFSTATKMYIATNAGLYEYTFSTPTVAPVLLSITGMIDSDLQDACLDPITGYVWAGHATGLSRINLGAGTATQYLNTSGQPLDGLSNNEANVKGGQLEAYNGRVLKGGLTDISGGGSAYATAWVMDDGVGYYRVNSTNTAYSCCLRPGTTDVVWRYDTYLRLYTVTVTGTNTGSSVQVEAWTSLTTVQNNLSKYTYIGSNKFVLLSGYISGNYNTFLETYTIGATPVASVIRPTLSGSDYFYDGNGFGWAMAAFSRNKIDVDGNGTYAFIWHNYLIQTAPGVALLSYGWDGANWVKDNANDRAIPKTATHTLVNGLSVDFNNDTGQPWDQQFVLNERFNFVHGPYRIKDNLQELQVKARSYFCEATPVVEYAASIPGSVPYEIEIPETVDPDFRDMDTIDFLTEVYKGASRYTQWTLPAATGFTVNVGTDELTTGTNIATGTPVLITETSYPTYFPPLPLRHEAVYYAINVSSTKCKLAYTYADAIGGTPIDITLDPYAGYGTHFITPLAPTTGTYRAGINGRLVFSSVDASSGMTLSYTWTKFTT